MARHRLYRLTRGDGSKFVLSLPPKLKVVCDEDGFRALNRKGETQWLERDVKSIEEVKRRGDESERDGEVPTSTRVAAILSNAATEFGLILPSGTNRMMAIDKLTEAGNWARRALAEDDDEITQA